MSPYETKSDLWGYVTAGPGRADPVALADLSGFGVEALDGRIGIVEQATQTPRRSYMVVDFHPWISGSKVLLPAGLIDRIDADTRTVHVDRTKGEIKGAPELGSGRFIDDAYLAHIGGYFGGLGGLRR